MLSFTFLPHPVSGIIFDKAVEKKKSQNKTNKQKQQQQKLLLNKFHSAFYFYN